MWNKSPRNLRRLSTATKVVLFLSPSSLFTNYHHLHQLQVSTIFVFVMLSPSKCQAWSWTQNLDDIESQLGSSALIFFKMTKLACNTYLSPPCFLPQLACKKKHITKDAFYNWSFWDSDTFWFLRMWYHLKLILVVFRYWYFLANW